METLITSIVILAIITCVIEAIRVHDRAVIAKRR